MGEEGRRKGEKKGGGGRGGGGGGGGKSPWRIVPGFRMKLPHVCRGVGGNVGTYIYIYTARAVAFFLTAV